MPTIEIEDDVYRMLQAQARPFEDTPSSVLRRVLNRPAAIGSGAELTCGQHAAEASLPEPLGLEAVGALRASAIESIERHLGVHHGREIHLARTARPGGRLGQRYLTPEGQVLHVRTRSYDPEKQPFFSFDREALEEVDWMVFVCGGRGTLIAPGQELRELARGLSLDRNGTYKPTFIVEGDRCEIYAFGRTRSVKYWREAFSSISDAESHRTRLAHQGALL